MITVHGRANTLDQMMCTRFEVGPIGEPRGEAEGSSHQRADDSHHHTVGVRSPVLDVLVGAPSAPSIPIERNRRCASIVNPPTGPGR